MGDIMNSLTNSQMMMNKSVREAADDIGLSAGQFIDWIECNQGSDYKINVDEKNRTVCCVYSDGDGGAMYIEGTTFFYEAEAVRICMIDDIPWCEVLVKDLVAVLKEIEEHVIRFCNLSSEEEYRELYNPISDNGIVM